MKTSAAIDPDYCDVLEIAAGPNLGERKMWAAVLTQAVACARGAIDSQHRRAARAWFFSPDRYTGSFRWICDALELNVADEIITELYGDMASTSNQQPLELRYKGRE